MDRAGAGLIGDLLRAEAVAFPLASWSGISHEVSRLQCDGEGKADKNNKGLATAFDWQVIQAYGREVSSVDQISRLSRNAWYGRVPAEGCDKPLEKYVRDLTEKLFKYHQGVADEGFFLKQDVEPDFWRQLTTKISPDLFLAAAALNTRNGKRLLGRQSRVKIHTPFLDHTQKLVEQHVHLGACYPFDVLWVQALKHGVLLGKKDDKKKDKVEIFKTRGGTLDLRPLLIRAAVARMILISFLAGNLDASNKLGQYINRELNVQSERDSRLKLLDALCASDFWREAEHEGELLDDEMIKNRHHPYLNALESEEEILRGFADKSELKLNDWLCVRVPEEFKDAPTAEPFLLYYSLEHLKKMPGDEHFRAMFWQLIRCKNLFYQRLIQQDNVYGLHYFSWFYDQISPFRQRLIGKKIQMAEAHLNQSGRLRALELRCGPADKGEQRDEFRDYASDYLELLNSESPEQPDAQPSRGASPIKVRDKESPKQRPPHWRDRCPRIGLVVHFIKKIDNGRPFNGCGDKRGEVRRHRYEKYFNDRWDEMDACASLLERAPALSHFFRGLDVANLEREIPGWVFAHIFREFRERLDFAVIDPNQEFRQLHLTAHLGEDFLHPISGLRRIDEGMEHFGMETGDRIGHAIALGLDLEEWAKRYKGREITVPLNEHLDDLAWEWWLYSARQGPAVVDAISFLERDFLRNTDQIFDSGQCSEHEISTVSLRKWAKAYDRRHDTEKLLKLGLLIKEEGRIRPRTQQRSEVTEVKKGKLSEIDRYCEAYLYCERLWREISNAEEVEVTIDEHYLQRAQALQEWLQRRFNSKNLIAEVCPTSNVVIARLGGYANHPAFKFDDPRSGVDRVRFTVNADDPLTFNTTVEDELSHLYRAMGEFHGDVQRPETWVQKRCETSTQTSFVVPDTVSLEDHRKAIKKAIKDLGGYR